MGRIMKLRGLSYGAVLFAAGVIAAPSLPWSSEGSPGGGERFHFASQSDSRRAPTLQQQAYLSYTQLGLAQPPVVEQLDVDSKLIGADQAAGTISSSMRRVVRELMAATGLGVPRDEELIEEFREVLAVYLEGTQASVVRYWERNELQPIDAACPCNSAEMWEARTRTLRGARLSSELVFARPRYLDGALVETAFTLPVSSIADRAGRYPRVDAPSQWGLSVFELIVAVEAVDSEGRPFLGYLGLWMTYDHRAETPRWVLSKVSIYNRPDFVGVVLPNL